MIALGIFSVSCLIAIGYLIRDINRMDLEHSNDLDSLNKAIADRDRMISSQCGSIRAYGERIEDLENQIHTLKKPLFDFDEVGNAMKEQAQKACKGHCRESND